MIKNKPIDSESVERCLESKFGESLGNVRSAMRDLAKTFRPAHLSENAFRLYEKFRPAIPEGVTGWGAKGNLDFNRIRSLACDILPRLKPGASQATHSISSIVDA
jgi:hypothetical protein